MDDHSLDKVGDDFRGRLLRELRSTAVGPYAQYRAGAMERMRPQRRPLRIAGALTTAAAAIVLAVLIGSMLADVRRNAATQPSPSPAASGAAIATASATPLASPTASLSPGPTAAGPLVTHDSPVLGYRIALPETYRRLSTDLFIGQPELLGRVTYTNLTEAEERAECQRDLGDLPSPTGAALLHVEVHRNVAGLSVVEWVNTPRAQTGYVFSLQREVQPLTIGGREAVRLVDDATAQTHALVIRADELIYVLTPSMWPSRHALEDIAATFGTVAREPFPTATPTPAPAVRRQGASELARSLAAAFAARDAEAVARLMPECHLGVSPLIDGGALPNSGGGGLSRSVVLFTQALRERFAAGDLTVRVDPTLQVDSVEGFYVRSEWQEPDRTVRIDLMLSDHVGRWRWSSARHHYQRADLGDRLCIPYRSPWVSGTSRC